MDTKKWFEETSRRRVTDSTIAEILKVTRKTANKRINEGLTADDLIAISRGLGVSPIHALVEMGKITYKEVLDLLGGKGTLLADATHEQLIYQLAEEALPASDRIALGATAKAMVDRRDELASRRGNEIPDLEGLPYVADSSPDEPGLGDEDYHDGP